MTSKTPLFFSLFFPLYSRHEKGFQVEFYFSDSNLPKDNFLKKTIRESEDGIVSLALICLFSRMRGHLSLGEVKPEDVTEATLNAVADTLRKSSTFLKISEDGKKVGRTTELSKPEEVIEQVNGRIIAASPLEHIVKMEDVESYFGQFGKGLGYPIIIFQNNMNEIRDISFSC